MNLASGSDLIYDECKRGWMVLYTTRQRVNLKEAEDPVTWGLSWTPAVKKGHGSAATVYTCRHVSDTKM